MRIPVPITLWIVLLLAWSVGCSQDSTSSNVISTPPPDLIEQGHAGHDHAHGHSHAELGPNGGHLLELGEEQFHAEWVHDDESGKLTVFILNGEGKELVPIAAEKVTIEKKVGERTDTYDLSAMDRQGEPPMTAKFEIIDKALIEGLKLVGDGVEATISIDVNGQPFTARFTKHEHDHDHGHKH